MTDDMLVRLLTAFAERQCNEAGLTRECEIDAIVRDRDADVDRFFRRIEAYRVRRVICSQQDAESFLRAFFG